MKILFTKKGIEDEVNSKLFGEFQNDFVEVIQINFLEKEPINIQNKSLIFTSLNAVKSFFQNDFKILINKIYCVGNKSEHEFSTRNFPVFKTEKNAENLAEFIIENAQNEDFIHFCGNLSLDVLEKKMTENQISYQKEIIYETELLFPKIEEKYDAVVFFSPSGVRSFAKFNSLDGFKIFSIGKTTENELKNYTKNPIFSSKKNTLENLLEIIKEVENHD